MPSMYGSALWMCTPSASHVEHHGIAAEGNRTETLRQVLCMIKICSAQGLEHLTVKLGCSRVSLTLTRTAAASF